MVTPAPAKKIISAVGIACKKRAVRTAIRAVTAADKEPARNIFQPTSAITWTGFLQFIGPASRCKMAFAIGTGLAHFIGSISFCSRPPPGACSEPSRRDQYRR